jgi:hypothetical protein
MVDQTIQKAIFTKDENSYFVAVGGRALRFYFRDYENQQTCYDAAKRWQHKQEDHIDPQKSANKLSATLVLFSKLIERIGHSAGWKLFTDDDTVAFVTDGYIVFIADTGKFAICLDKKKIIVSGLNMDDVVKIVSGLNSPFIPVDIHWNDSNIEMAEKMVEALKSEGYGY